MSRTSLTRLFAVVGALAIASSAWGAPSLRRMYQKAAKPLGDEALVQTAEGSAHLDRTHYEDVRDGALALMAKYPPKSSFYLALGRSPVSMYTFLRALDKDMTAVFPASDLRMGIAEENHGAYFKHFERYIPKDVLAGKRGDIVIFDRSHDRSGSSLAVLKPVLEKYLKSKGYRTKVTAVGFAGQGPLVKGVRFISTRSFPNVFIYNAGNDGDENVATYVGHHTIGTHAPSDLTSNPQHREFARQMENRMMRDDVLDKALRTSPQLKGLVAQE